MLIGAHVSPAGGPAKAVERGAAIGARAIQIFNQNPRAWKPTVYSEEAVAAADQRAAAATPETLAESEGCPLLLENTAGAGGTLGRSFEELARLIELAGADARLGVCLDSAHLLASGYDIRSAQALAGVLDSFHEIVGLDRLKALHVNDSQAPLGANRDRHAPLGEGEIGRAGCAAFLSEPRFDGLPCIFEGPGVGGSQVQGEDIAIANALRAEGLAARP